MSRVDRLTDDDLEIIEDALKAGVYICDVSTSMGRVYRRKFMRALSILHGCGPQIGSGDAAASGGPAAALSADRQRGVGHGCQGQRA